MNKIKIKGIRKLAKILIVFDVLCLFAICILLQHIDKRKEKEISSLQKSSQIINLNTTENINDFEKAAKDTMAWDYLDPDKTKSLKEWQEINNKIYCILKVSKREFPVILNDDTYLSKDVYGNYDYIGTPYCLSGERYKVILAHSVYGGSHNELMFTFLQNYTKEEYFKENSLITIIDKDGEHSYQAIALVNVDHNNDEWNGWYTEKPIIYDLINWIEKEAIYRLDIPINKDTDNFLALVTCDISKENARHFLFFKEVE